MDQVQQLQKDDTIKNEELNQIDSRDEVHRRQKRLVGLMTRKTAKYIKEEIEEEKKRDVHHYMYAYELPPYYQDNGVRHANIKGDEQIDDDDDSNSVHSPISRTAEIPTGIQSERPEPGYISDWNATAQNVQKLQEEWFKMGALLHKLEEDSKRLYRQNVKVAGEAAEVKENVKSLTPNEGSVDTITTSVITPTENDFREEMSQKENATSTYWDEPPTENKHSEATTTATPVHKKHNHHHRGVKHVTASNGRRVRHGLIP